MAQWKLKKSWMREPQRIKTEIKQHVRHRSQQAEKANPWDMIGKALTQRYNRKFLQIEKQSQQCTINANLDGMQQKNTPKFQIKRKYLSFDYKGRQHAIQTRSNYKIPLQYSPYRGLTTINSSMDNYKTPISKDLPTRRSMHTEQTPTGTYFVCHNINTYKPAYKCIYIKKNKKKMTTNPELQIVLKKAEEKQVEELGDGRESVRMKVKRMMDADNCYPWRKKNKLDKLEQTEKGEEKKMFRPWSGINEDEN